jgi:hypothetical protein
VHSTVDEEGRCAEDLSRIVSAGDVAGDALEYLAARAVVVEARDVEFALNALDLAVGLARVRALVVALLEDQRRSVGPRT